MKHIIINQRQTARRYAVQALYSWSITQNPVLEVINNYLEINNTKTFDREYFNLLLVNITELHQEIDQKFIEYLDRPIEKLDIITLSIIRLAIYEIFYLNLTPKIAINEALNLAKEFGAESSYKFINNLLDQIKP